MQDEINEKTIALYIKTGKLTAQTLQKAMKTLLAQMKKQKDKPPQGKQTLTFCGQAVQEVQTCGRCCML